ncbi:MAG: PAS domain S-box protein [Verrucomicrobiota bacterium]
MAEADAPTLTADTAPDTAGQKGPAFPVVGIGASAGGLAALQVLFKELPVDTGMAFVVIMHLAPEHESNLADILARETQMPVAVVANDPLVEPNHIYVIPPARDMIITGGRLQLVPQQRMEGLHAIDHFFRALAEDVGHQAVGIVLSGGLSDGTLGLEEIKGASGVTFAQDETAEHESMPKSAIASGCVDYVLPPEGIAKELVRFARHPYLVPDEEGVAEIDGEPSHARVTEIVRRATGVDFTHYKSSTLQRRIKRRIMLNRMTTAEDYEDFLRRTPEEVEELYQDILIGVTSFFRNPDAFEALARDVFPKLIADCPKGEKVRLWVVGCSSGEEAYSLAMAFTECAQALSSDVQFQLFATDVNQRCVEKARAAWYPRTIAHDVSPERLKQFFVEEGGGYRIHKALREHCVFSRHNALADPPFLRMDFLSCRNMLIYLEPVLQQKIVPLFHYALKAGGWLWLGSSESAGTVRDLFDATDVRHKIYTRRAGGRTPSTRLQPAFSSLTLHEPMHARQPLQTALPRDAERLLLAKYAPPGVVVSGALEIVQFQGDTGPFLAPAAGAASLHLLKMLREGLPTAVRDAVQKAEQTGSTVRVENLRVRSNGGFKRLAVEVIPVKPGAAGKGAGFIVLFDEAGGKSAPAEEKQGSWLKRLWQNLTSSAAPVAWQTEEIAHLTEELATARETMQASQEQHDAATEELQSANEEAQSANEEMQSIYEELENSKAEIEARNKELTALSDELASRNAELNRVNDELSKSEHLYRAIGESINYGVWICEADGRNTYASESFLKLVGLTQDQCSNLGWGDLLHPEDAQETLDAWQECVRTGLPWDRQHRFRGVDGKWHDILARGVPMKDDQDRITQWAGINLDFGQVKQAEQNLRLSEQRFRNAVSILSSLVWTNSADGRMEGEQPAWSAFTGQTPEEYQGYGWAKAVHPDDAQPTVDAWQKAVSAKGIFEFEHRVRRADGEWRLCSVRAKPTLNDDGHVLEWVGVHTDITEKREVEQALRQREALFSKLVEQAPGGMYVVDESLRVMEMNSMTRPVFASAEPVIGRAFSEVMDIIWGPEQGPRLTAIFRHTLETGERYQSSNYTAVRQDIGEEQSYAWEAHRITLPSGRYGVVCYFNDVTEERALEARLRASEQRARQIVQSITDGFMTLDENWHITYLNPRGAGILEPLEKTADKLAGQDFWKEFPEMLGTELEEKLRLAMSQQAPAFFETYYPPLKQWFDIRAYPSPVGLTIYFLNVTERKQAIEALRKSEAFNRSIIESSPDCVKVLDLKGTLLSLEAGHGLLGVTDPAPLLGLPWIDFWTRPEDHAACTAAVAAAAAGGEAKFTGFFRTAHGYDKWWNVALTPILNSHGRPVSLLAVSRDVTEAREMEDALRASETRKDAILSSALDAIITMDHEGRLVEFNNAAERIFGYARADVIGKILADLIIPEHLRARHKQGLAHFLATGEGPVLNKQIELPALRADGTEFPAEFAIIPIPGTQPPMFTAFLRDITRRRQMETSLVTRAEQLAQADRNKDEFLAMLAHELRNPLAPLRNATELLKDDLLASSERAQAQSIIGRQIENMSRMLDDLLDVSRITEGKIEMRKKPVALESIITGALSLVRATCAAQNQQLSVFMPEEPLYLEADATRLEQVFGNLLTNAAKYSGEGSHITIGAERAPPAEPPAVIITVQDNGVGIDPDLLPRIFDLFVQASRTLDRSHGGLGIGLTLVQRLVKLHGGHIEARSQGLGHGAEFIVRLPILREAPKAAEASAAPAREAARRILIVDDNTDSARTLAMLQGRRGHQTCTAFTGPDALTAAQSFKPEVVLLDIGLPGMDGFEVARQIRALPGMAEVLLIAMSGYGSTEDRTTAKTAGFDDYLVKPIDLAALRARLAQGRD